LEAQLRENLASALDETWNDLLENFDSGVMEAVHHISSQIDISLLSAQREHEALLQKAASDLNIGVPFLLHSSRPPASPPPRGWRRTLRHGSLSG
jgi:hypothetical protein